MKSLHYLGDNIYWLTFSHRYHMCMTFWRITETKESTNSAMKNGMTLVDFMEWYAFEYGKGVFTYTADWAGFNVDNSDFKATYSMGNIDDFNKYDKMMNGLRNFIEGRLNSTDDPYYLIGTLDNDHETLKHEYAHALWSINSEYQELMKKKIMDLDPKVNNMLCKNLTKMGYSLRVHCDELQAYLSTGTETTKNPKDQFYTPLTKKQIGAIAEPFKDVFIQFSKGKLPRKKI